MYLHLPVLIPVSERVSYVCLHLLVREEEQEARGCRRSLLRTTMPSLKEGVFVSDELEKATAWFEFIMKQLWQSEAGVVCLTAENLESPWLHFEAGALASHFATAVSGGEQAGTTRPHL